MDAIETVTQLLAIVKQHITDNHGENNDTAVIERILRDIATLSHRAKVTVSATPVQLEKE